MNPRLVCQFSCGAASAVAAKLILSERQPGQIITVVNAFVLQEHADNRRFLRDVERWLRYPIVVLRDKKYSASTYEVWTQRRFMKNKFTAPCSGALKREVISSVMKSDDVSVIGYTADKRELERAERLEDLFPDERFCFPLIERGLTKSDCLAMIERAGILLPYMYRLGYQNANCIGCVKGGEGYWNKIRRDFPEEFIQIATIQESLGPGANLFRDRHTQVRYSLNDLPLNKGRYDDELDFSCGFACELAERDIG